MLLALVTGAATIPFIALQLAAVDEAMGGVLFVDEAYLSSPGFGGGWLSGVQGVGDGF